MGVGWVGGCGVGEGWVGGRGGGCQWRELNKNGEEDKTHISRHEEKDKERKRWGGPRLELNIYVFGACGSLRIGVGA